MTMKKVLQIKKNPRKNNLSTISKMMMMMMTFSIREEEIKKIVAVEDF